MRADNRAPRAAAQEIARRRHAQLSSQSTSASLDDWPDAGGARASSIRGLPLTAQPEAEPQRPQGSSARRERLSRPASPTVIDLSGSPASGTGISAQHGNQQPATSSCGDCSGRRKAMNLLEDELSDGDLRPEGSTAAPQQARGQPSQQQQPRKLTRLRKAGGSSMAGNGNANGGAAPEAGASSELPVGRRPAPASGDVSDLLASFGGLQVHNSSFLPTLHRKSQHSRLGKAGSQQSFLPRECQQPAIQQCTTHSYQNLLAIGEHIGMMAAQAAARPHGLGRPHTADARRMPSARVCSFNRCAATLRFRCTPVACARQLHLHLTCCE